ncbi:DnaD domain-containing protein [Jeotgalibacillus salarius]|uniref:DnaD domain protein n=1 Tax=Jeotgalibacillus salarius TaxID=546023 RepID=A0A4Y8LKE9_9BACL|nr:DnaD domain-containing protein [Jeotgalibacillus salarius]TFE03055.1 DnaD domain protein [Jeotgalibacillus salarius]
MTHQLPVQTWIREGYTAIPVMLLKYYKKLNLTETECMLLIQLHTFIDKGNLFPTPDQIAERMTLTSSECLKIIQKLMKKNLLEINDGEEEIKTEHYSMDSLWHAILTLAGQEKFQETVEQTMSQQTDLYTMFEQEFGRPLSPLECETLAMWIDQDGHTPDIVKAALKEAVISEKLNFRYIDRILFEWKKKGINTAADAKKQGEQFRKPKQQAEKPHEPAPFFNWLEN